ncbi:hypothetical protein HNY73_013162 [Argiope bruennichi]|uniref:Uncharacterized protein n=1 Tax=Argiope bruennichi TaxID=94029 RepID=A0A8T0EYT8_ARGBR|nr:hypothetical protein HNY73_013162 [Argiope bruennichi]
MCPIFDWVGWFERKPAQVPKQEHVFRYVDDALETPYPSFVRGPPRSPVKMFDDIHNKAVKFFALPPAPKDSDRTFINFVKSTKICEKMREDTSDEDENIKPAQLSQGPQSGLGQWAPKKLLMANQTFPEGSAHATAKPIPIPYPTANYRFKLYPQQRPGRQTSVSFLSP